jgi:hypothetical protein
MPNGYVAPTGYSEPVQIAPKTRLKTAINEDFRAAHMAEHTWTLLPLGGGPESRLEHAGHADPALVGVEVREQHRATCAGAERATRSSTRLMPALTVWWSALSTFGRSTGLTLTAAPKFHWAAYSDLVVNSVMFSPMSTFFVHPNGTYAYFDQTHFYNTNGLPIRTGVTGTDSNYNLAQYWDATKVEHWIIDKVHLAFQLGKRKVEGDELPRAVQRRSGSRCSRRLSPSRSSRSSWSDLKATVTKLPSGTVSPYGLSLQVAWGGHNYRFGEDTVPNGSGIDGGDGNSGTIDWSLDYIHDGQLPQLADTHITFSSCVLIEALNG